MKKTSGAHKYTNSLIETNTVFLHCLAVIFFLHRRAQWFQFEKNQKSSKSDKIELAGSSSAERKQNCVKMFAAPNQKKGQSKKKNWKEETSIHRLFPHHHFEPSRARKLETKDRRKGGRDFPRENGI